MKKPIPRSKLRLMLGKIYYTWRRYAKWMVDGTSFAKSFSQEKLPHVVFQHDTPTLRKLKDVDMWLQHNKEINLSIAIKRLNGLLLQPGETMSYWKLIGKTTARKGYVPGMVLFYGGFKPGVGGGLCQLSNLIYWMTLHTPLAVVERHRQVFNQEGERINDEFITENNALMMYSPLLTETASIG